MDINDARHNIETNGVLVLDRYLDTEITQALAIAFEAMENQGRATARDSSGNRSKRGVVFARRNLLSLDFMQRFISSSQVQSMVKHLCPGAVAVRTILFDKTGEANWTVPWHQDRSIAVIEKRDVPGFGPWSNKAGVVHVQPPTALLRQMLTLRFSLDQCGPDNGPLRAITGTHMRLLTPDEIDALTQSKASTICTTEAGGVVIMRPLLLHASSPAKQVGRRRVLHIEFGPPELPSGLRWAMA